MTFLIEHALVMDTDHLPGGGGYSVAAVSPGTSEAERVFVAENFGISDFLHDPHNERVYFSVFRIPGGRMAFVRRFSHGTRRNGVQSRLFVHTLFLDEALLEELAYLPWLILDRPLRLGDSEIFLSTDPEPLLHDSRFPALEWNGTITKSEAFEQLALRYQQLQKRLRQEAEPSATAIESALDRIAQGRSVRFPQGSVYEQLSLLIWSMLPPADRMQLAWTQHESANISIAFTIANEPGTIAAVDVSSATASPSSKQLVASSTTSAEEWSGMQAAMVYYSISLRTRDVDAWLRWRDALRKLFEDPLAGDDILIPRLEAVAQAVRADRRDRWVNELEVLRFLLSLVTRAASGHQAPDLAIRRLAGLFERSSIAELVFRVPPPSDLLDDYEQPLGASALVECFLRGSERVQGASVARDAVAAWLLQRSRATGVAISILGRFLERLAIDGSEYVKPLLQDIVARPHGLKELASVLPPQKPEIGDAVVTAVIIGIQNGHPDTAAFIHSMLLPQLAQNGVLSRRFSPTLADSIGAVLRNAPQDFAEFATRMPVAVASSLVAAVSSWMTDDRRATLPLLRAILMEANRGKLPGVSTDDLAFQAAESGETSSLWLPAALDTAARIDGRGDVTEGSQFLARVSRLKAQPGGDPDALRQVVSALRQRTAQRGRAGACTRALVRFLRPWPDNGALAEALCPAIAEGVARASEWSDIVSELVSMRDPAASPALGRVLLAYWERIGAGEFGAVPPALIDALPQIDVEAHERVVARWLPLLRSLPDSGDAEHFIEALASLAQPRLRASVEVERAWRDIEYETADAATLTRLDAALRASGGAHEQLVRAAITKIVERMPAIADRALWLVRAGASPLTLPTTRRIIERHFLGKVLTRLDQHSWPAFLSNAGNDLFVHGNILLTVTSELALSTASEETLRKFQRHCDDRGRSDALAIASGASRGFLESLSVLSSKSIDRFREGR